MSRMRDRVIRLTMTPVNGKERVIEFGALPTFRFVLVLLLATLGGWYYSACASAPAHAQSSVTLGWDQAGPDLPTVQAYTYKLYLGTATTGTQLTVTCPAGGTVDTTIPFSCTASPIPEPPGTYTVEATASNAAGESLQSSPFSFTLVGLPAPPKNLRKK